MRIGGLIYGTVVTGGEGIGMWRGKGGCLGRFGSGEWGFYYFSVVACVELVTILLGILLIIFLT